MIKFGPNRYNPEEDSYDAPFKRMNGSRFTMSQIQEVQSETLNPIDTVLETSDQQQYVDKLVHNMNNHIVIIQQNGDREQAQNLARRIDELKSIPLDDDIVRAYENLHQHIAIRAQAFDK